MLTNSKESILTMTQVSPMLGINSTSLKFICEICGLITENMDSLKSHLRSHDKTEYDVINENNSHENHFNQKETDNQFSPKLVNTANSKINSIIANVKFSPMNSSAINIPQSMTVFKLKDISSKFKNIKRINLNQTNKISNKTISTILLPKTSQNLATGSAILKVLNSDNNLEVENQITGIEKTQYSPNKFVECQINKTDHSIDQSQNVEQIQSEHPRNEDKLTVVIGNMENVLCEQSDCKNGNNLIINLKSLSSTPTPISPDKSNISDPTDSKLSQTNIGTIANNNLNKSGNVSSVNTVIPYHYSEFESTYICNLCNCTYESLRSIKAHIWKHSGHHELSYPINDYNRSLEPLKNNMQSSQPASSSKSTILKRPIRSVQFQNTSKQMNNSDQLIQQSISLDDFKKSEFRNLSEKCPSGLISIKNEVFQLIKSESMDNFNQKSLKLITEQECALIESNASLAATSANSNNRANGGGICSVLLEVIEKLHEESTSSSSQTESHNNKDDHPNKAKRSKRTKNDTIRIKNETNSKRTKPRSKMIKRTNNRIRNLMQLRLKANEETIEDNAETNKNNHISNNNLIFDFNSKEICKTDRNSMQNECKIETSVVNCLFEEDAPMADYLNEESISKQTDYKQFNYICLKCFDVFNSKTLLNEHRSKENDCTKSKELLSNSIINNNNSDFQKKRRNSLKTTKTIKQTKLLNETFFICEFCNDSLKDLKIFTEIESLLDHCKNSHEKEIIENNKYKLDNSHRVRSSSASSSSSTTPKSSPSASFLEFDSSASSSSDSNNSLTSDNKQSSINIKTLLKNILKNDSVIDLNNNETRNCIDYFKNIDLISLLSSLASNDGYEQYVCRFCSHVCYHLPSLKSHMWTHVKNIKFDYLVITSIINAALDYESKLNRKLNLIKKSRINISNEQESKSNKDDSNELDEEIKYEYNNNIYLERQLISALELINYSQNVSKLCDEKNNDPMISFRCSRCGFETIDLSLLRLHKREHYLKGVNINDNFQLIQQASLEQLNHNSNINATNDRNSEIIS